MEQSPGAGWSRAPVDGGRCRARVALASEGRRTIPVTALSDADPDERDLQPDRRLPARLWIEPR
jgi:hypothetical protein